MGQQLRRKIQEKYSHNFCGNTSLIPNKRSYHPWTSYFNWEVHFLLLCHFYQVGKKMETYVIALANTFWTQAKVPKNVSLGMEIFFVGASNFTRTIFNTSFMTGMIFPGRMWGRIFQEETFGHLYHHTKKILFKLVWLLKRYIKFFGDNFFRMK